MKYFWGCSYLVKWGRTFVYDVSPRINGFKLFQLLVSIANKKYRLYVYVKSLNSNATGLNDACGSQVILDLTHLF